MLALVKPRQAVVFHFFNDFDTAPEIEREIRKHYQGPLALAQDLMVFNVTKDSDPHAARGHADAGVAEQGASRRVSRGGAQEAADHVALARRQAVVSEILALMGIGPDEIIAIDSEVARCTE